MKKFPKLLLIVAGILLSSCSTFKKGCDCPSFGGKGHSQHRGPGW